MAEALGPLRPFSGVIPPLISDWAAATGAMGRSAGVWPLRAAAAVEARSGWRREGSPGVCGADGGDLTTTVIRER